MTYLTVTEYARRMGLSPRRIRVLCTAGRIAGAVKIGPRAWAIPESAPLPERTPGRPKIERPDAL